MAIPDSSPLSNAGPAPGRVFVGRERELAELGDVLGRAGVGGGAICLVVGEAGIGKTRFAEEVAAAARGRGFAVLWGACLEDAGAPPLWPWRQALEVHSPALLAPAPNGQEPIEAARFARFEAVVALLQRLAAERPLLLVLEDLHCADHATLLLLRFVARVVRTVPLVILATSRQADGEADTPRGELWAAALREARSVPLSGLERDAIAELLARVFSVSPPEELCAALREHTGGNPFFVDGVARLLAAQGRLDGGLRVGERLPLPSGVRHAILARLAPLPRQTRQLLRAAALIGMTFDPALAAAAADLGPGEIDDALRLAGAERLLRFPAGRDGPVAFRHAIIRDTVREDLGPTARAALHLRIGRALEAGHGGDPAERLDELAHHFSAALPEAPLDAALSYLVRAAERDMATLAFEAAAQLLGAAIDLLAARSSGTSVPAERRCELLLRRGEALWGAGRAVEAQAVYDRAIAAARAIGDPRLLARAVLGRAFELGGFSYAVTANRAVLAGLREAIAALPEAETALRARCLARLSLELHNAAAPEESRACAREALALAEQLGDERVLLAALYANTWSHAGPDLPPEAMAAIADRILHYAARVDDRESEFRGHHLRVAVSLMLGDRQGLDVAMGACRRIATELQMPIYLWQSGVFESMRALLAGRLSEATRLAEAARDIGLATVGEVAMVSYMTLVHNVLMAEGRGAEFASTQDAAIQQYPHVAAWVAGAILVLIDADRRAEARALFDRFHLSGFDGIARDDRWFVTVSALGWAGARLGAVEATEKLYVLLSPYAAQGIDIHFGRHFCGSMAAVLGRMAASIGRFDEAFSHFRRAEVFHLRLGAMRFLAETRCDHAEALLARGEVGDPAEAAELVASARAVAVELGLLGALAHCERLSSRLLSRTTALPSPAPVPAAFVRSGPVWLLRYAGKERRLAHSKGMGYLAALLARPGAQIHVFDLVGAEAPGAARASAEGPARRGLGGTGPTLDRQARAAYRDRLAELRAELEQAAQWSDLRRRERLQAEVDALTAELAGALGLGGRDRPSADHADRLRKAVSKCLRAALASISAEHPPLGEHLRRALRLGVICSYMPTSPIDWQL